MLLSMNVLFVIFAASWFNMLTSFPFITVTDTSMHGEVPDFYEGKTDYNTK